MKIPKSWADISIANFSAYLKVSKKKQESHDVAYITQKVAAILGITIEDARKIPIEDVNKITRLIAKLPTRLMLSFKLNGQRYRPIKANRLNGEVYTAVKLIQSRGADENLHHLLFLISEPRKFGLWKTDGFFKFKIGWKTVDFKPEELEDKINDFKQLSVDIGWPMVSFFLRVCEELKHRLKEFSLSELDKMTEQMRKLQADLESDTDLPQ